MDSRMQELEKQSCIISQSIYLIFDCTESRILTYARTGNVTNNKQSCNRRTLLLLLRNAFHLFSTNLQPNDEFLHMSKRFILDFI